MKQVDFDHLRELGDEELADQLEEWQDIASGADDAAAATALQAAIDHIYEMAT